MTLDAELLAQSYEAAADYIDAHGWHQGELAKGYVYRDELGLPGMDQVLNLIKAEQPPVCAMGAGYAVGVKMCGSGRQYGSITTRFSVINMIEWMTPLEEFICGTNLAEWNDSTHRTQEEVVDFLRLSASKIRMGNIGDNPREYEFEPFPDSEPMIEPAAPQPAPAQPEKVPA